MSSGTSSGMKGAVAGLCLPLVAVALIGFAYSRGYAHGKAEGEAALRAARLDRAEEKLREAEAFGRALADALAAYEAETARVGKLTEQLQRERQDHERKNRALEKRIGEVAGGRSHVFSRDFVCLLNAAAGVCDAAVSRVPGAVFSDSGASPCAAFGPGLLEGFTGVTEADLLSWFIEYADRCRLMETQLSGWRAISGGGEEK